LQGIVIIKDFRIVFTNSAFAGITGYSVDELLTMQPAEIIKLVHPDDRELIWGNFRKRMAGQDIPANYRFKGLTRDGKQKILELYASLIEYEGGPAIQGVILDVTDQVAAEDNLKQRTRLIEAIVKNIPFGIAVSEIDTGKSIFINDEFKDIYGLSDEEDTGLRKFWTQAIVAPEERKNITNKLKTDIRQKKPEDLFWNNIEILTKKGDKKYISVKNIPLYDLNLMLLTAEDVTDRIKAEKDLQDSLHEKDILVREIHHRIKNNLQTISSLLDLQAESITDRKSLEAFRNSQSRIRSMALIHERLYKSEDLSKIEAPGYVNSLIQYLENTYGSPSWKIEINAAIDNIYLDLDTAIPCGLIINELVSNSIKHAFTENHRGSIHVTLRGDDNKNLLLVIGDNGVGIPESFNPEKSESLGLQLVSLLTKQLNGSIKIDRVKGTTFTVTFPKPPIAEKIENNKETEK
jgi:PAS domain S-box-containing protein